MARVLDELLSDEGWAYASTPPVEPGDPGRFHALFGRDSLITALQVLPERPDVARATLRALAALQGQPRRPGDRRGAGQDLARVPPARRAALRRARLAGARRAAPLLRLGRLHVVVPRRARGARRRRAERRARARAARRRRLARARAGARRRPRPLRPADELRAGSPSRAGATPPRRSRRTPTAAASCARTAARRRRRRPTPTSRRSPTRRCARSATRSALERALALRRDRARLRPGRDGARGRRPAGAGRRLPARLAAVVGRAPHGARGDGGRGACASPTSSRPSACARSRRPARCSIPRATTAARSGRSTRGWGGAGCAPPASHEEAERVRSGVLAALDAARPGARALRGRARRASSSPRRRPTACRRGRSARAGRSSTAGTAGRSRLKRGSGIGSPSSPTNAPCSSSITPGEQQRARRRARAPCRRSARAAGRRAAGRGSRAGRGRAAAAAER